jgi:hypothetical protein
VIEKGPDRSSIKVKLKGKLEVISKICARALIILCLNHFQTKVKRNLIKDKKKYLITINALRVKDNSMFHFKQINIF